MQKILIAVMVGLFSIGSVFAQDINFNKIYKEALEYTVSVNLVVEVSFGTQTSDAKSRSIGTIVSPDGLIIFDGAPLNNEDPFSLMPGVQISTEPKSAEVVMMDGTKFPAEYIGLDRFTGIAFCRILPDKKRELKFVTFQQKNDFKVGEWIALYSLLPEYVTPRLSADIGLVSAIIDKPERFVLTVGFNEMQLTSVLYDKKGIPVGILGDLQNSALSDFDAARAQEQISDASTMIPLLGLLGGDRLSKLIQNPPKKGKIDRGWMGIYLQALTPDIADFWGVKSRGGIIVNEVVKDSPADTADIKTGDILIKLAGTPIEVSKEENLPIFQKQISEMGAGAKADFLLLRRHDGAVDTLERIITLAQAPLSPVEAKEYEDTNFEMKIRDMVFVDYNAYNLDPKIFEGVVVKEVEPGGWSAVGDIIPGDIIQSISGMIVASVDDARIALEQIAQEKPEEVVFFIWRDNKTLFLNIKTDWQ